MSKAKRPALGRGLSALLPSAAKPAASAAAAPAAEAADDVDALRTVAIEQLEPNPDQPRKYFDEAALGELADSIKAQGILQPIVASPIPGGGGARRYLIIAGERRWRAAQLAGLHQVPVVVRHDVPESRRLELALIENIQRADLNPIEEARAYAELVELRGYSQEELGAAVGKDRSTVANAMRLLKLPPKVADLVLEGRLSMGHARAILGLTHEDAMTRMATEVARKSLSVRATEAAVRKALVDEPEAEFDDEQARRKIIVSELETRLRRRLGVRVRLKAAGKKGNGTVEIPYASLDELDRLLKVILSTPV